MPTLAELMAQRDELEAKIKAASQTDRADAIAKGRALMQENGLSVADLSASSKGKGRATAGKGKAKSGKKVAVKYRDGAGNAWSGRGLQPKWLKAALAASKKTLADFAV